jgi:uncharacterized membrane protein YhhN
MIEVALIAVVVALLVGLLVGEKRENRTLMLGFKTPLSMLFVVTAVIQPHPVPSYYHYVLMGLILGLVGDVCLALPGNTAFRAGLAAFLAGHILYVIAFATLSHRQDWIRPEMIGLLLCSGGVARWLWPHLGSMRIPVAAYIIVITAMMFAAVAAFHNLDVKRSGTILILAGAALFYFSDIWVARDRFVKHGFMNRLIGLPSYFAGQFMLGFSIGVVA